MVTAKNTNYMLQVGDVMVAMSVFYTVCDYVLDSMIVISNFITNLPIRFLVIKTDIVRL